MTKVKNFPKNPMLVMDIRTRSLKKLKERKKFLEDAMMNNTEVIHRGDTYSQINGIKVVPSGLFYHQLYFTGVLVDTHAKANR